MRRFTTLALFAVAASALVGCSAAPDPAGPACGPVPHRRRPRQRDRHGNRRRRPVRARPPEGGLPRLRRGAPQPIAAFQRRTRAGQPRHRPRHQRQHGRREDPGGTRGARSISVSAAGSRGRSLPVTGSTTLPSWSRTGRPTSSGSATRSAGFSRAAAPRCTTRSRKRSAWRSRGATERKRSSSFRMATTRAAGPMCSRSSSSFDRPRCWCTRSGSTVRRSRWSSGTSTQAASAASSTHADPVSVPDARRTAALAAAAAAPARSGRADRRRPAVAIAARTIA